MITHKSPTYWGGSLLLLAFSFLAFSQTHQDQASEQSKTIPAAQADFCVLKYDPASGVIKAVSGDSPEYAYLNTPEKRAARQKAILAVTKPDEYNRLYPKSSEQIQAEQKAAYDLTHPRRLSEVLAEPKSPERLQSQIESVLSMTDPQDYHRLLERRKLTNSVPTPTP
jgi:hypothetical protein